ncbi:MAG: hypothetical protein C4542_07400 [Dehalococcoidia bacterium]|nr:MAG: hypothetical protein C4542_07400 [Dehalococcoidia bacterium]
MARKYARTPSEMARLVARIQADNVVREHQLTTGERRPTPFYQTRICPTCGKARSTKIHKAHTRRT